MFFFLSKILDVFLTPISWIFVLLLLSLFLKNKRTKKRLLISAILVFFVCSNHLIVNTLFQSWEYEPQQLPQNKTYDVAIVLTGITDNIKKPHDRVYFKQGAERITTPLIFYKKGIVKKILITGGTGSRNKEAQAESELLKGFLLDNGVPNEAIIIENQSMNTRQNALNTQQKLTEYPELKTKLLITSSFHMNRSIACFKKVGVDFTPYPVDFYSTNSNITIAKVLIPNADTFKNCTKLIHEVAGYVIYKVIGYI